MKRIFLLIVILVTVVNSGKCDNEKLLSGKEFSSVQCNSKPYTLLHFGIGMQKSFYAELRLSRFKYSGFHHSKHPFNYYGAIEWMPNLSKFRENNLFGLKAGYELNLRIVVIAIEPKYLTNGNIYNLFVTPKVGFNFSRVILYYGYNIPAIGIPFSKVGNHQFSLVIQFGCRISKK